jgi:Bacterial antitoxin of ParD toxin-antitoxin type II system and RHH
VNPNVSLTESWRISSRPRSPRPRYSSSSEVVREALRLMEKIERQEAKKFQFLDSGGVGAPHIPLADIANWGVPQPVAEGDR